MPNLVRPSVAQVIRTRKYAFSIVFWIFVVHLVAIVQFTRGFLLTRPVLPNRSDVASLKAPPFERAVVLVVDALRYDFVVTPEGASESPFLRHFPVENICDDPAQSFSVKFIADPPTTTLQRLKGLTTGSLPAFIDAGSNFAGFKIEEDNWVGQAAAKLGPVSFVGDDTWEALFAQELSENYPYPSLNVRDLDTVDNGVKEHLSDMIRNQSNRVVIGHMLGVDHVGHRYGPSHPAMSVKLEETFEFVKEIADLIEDNTVLFVMGDHGMDPTGNHGGDSKEELEAALWVYSKQPIFTEGGHSTVNQIDLVPTISGLLGLPIPYNSLGFPIRQAFGSLSDWEQLCSLSQRQIEEYSDAVGMTSTKERALQHVSQFNEGTERERAFQEYMLVAFKEAWAQFDVGAMQRGIALLFASIVTSVLFYSAIHVPLLRQIARNQGAGAAIGSLIGLVFSLDKLKDSGLQFGISTSVYAGVGIIVMGFIPLVKSLKFTRPSGPTTLALGILGLEVASSFSNSFIIWESKILQFLIATAITAFVIISARNPSPLVTYLGCWYSAVLLLLTRVSSSWILCREETASRCATTFFEPESSMVPTWTLFALGVVILFLPYYLARFWIISQNNVGVSTVILNMTSLALALTIGYWSLDNAEARGWIAHDAFGLQSGKVLLSRLTLLLGVGGGIAIWWRSSLPIEIVLSKMGAPEKISGYNNIFGSYSMLSVVCVFWTIAIANKPPAVLALVALLYSCLASLDALDITGTKYTLLAPVLFDMLAHGYFYFTGHQATIASIQWDSAFIATKTVNFLWSPLTLIFNTYGAFIICSLVCLFSSLWRRTPFKDPLQPLAFIIRAFAGFVLVTGVRTIASVIAAYNLRRHLMTWKIFAPRFMLGGITLIVCDVACMFGILLSGHTIKKVAEIFG